MVVGESQILGQLRDALRRRRPGRNGQPGAARAMPARAAGRQAGARRDRHRLGPAPSVVSVGAAAGSRRARRRRPAGRQAAGDRRRLDGRPGRAHPAAAAGGAALDVAVLNRTPDRAHRLAAEPGRPARSSGSSSPAEIARADVLVVAAPARSAPAGGRGSRRRARRAPAGRWCCSTSPCRATSTRRVSSCPTCTTSTSTRCAAGGDGRRAEVDGRAGDRRRPSCAVSSPPAGDARSRRPSPRCEPEPLRWWTAS